MDHSGLAIVLGVAEVFWAIDDSGKDAVVAGMKRVLELAAVLGLLLDQAADKGM